MRESGCLLSKSEKGQDKARPSTGVFLYGNRENQHLKFESTLNTEDIQIQIKDNDVNYGRKKIKN